MAMDEMMAMEEAGDGFQQTEDAPIKHNRGANVCFTVLICASLPVLLFVTFHDWKFEDPATVAMQLSNTFMLKILLGVLCASMSFGGYMGAKGGNPNPVILIVFVAIIWFCMGYAPYYTISQTVAINNMEPKKKYEKDSPLATLLTKVTFYLVLIGSVSCVCLFVANVCAKIRSDKK